VAVIRIVRRSQADPALALGAKLRCGGLAKRGS